VVKECTEKSHLQGILDDVDCAKALLLLLGS